MNPTGGPDRRRKILLVEDNEDDYLLVDGFLSSSDYELTWCNSASTARERLSQGCFDLVLLDHGLPDANGLSFLEELRADHPAVPVVVLSGRNDQALALSAMRMGAHSFLLKDELIEHLEDVVQEVVTAEVPVELETYAAGTEPGHRPKFMDTADRFYRTLLETMGEGCLVVDVDGVVTFANPALDELLACGSAKLLGRKLGDLFASEAEAGVSEALERLAAGREPRSIVLEAVLAPGYTRGDGVSTVRISMRSMHAPDGRFEAALLVISEISELLRAKQLLAIRYEQERIQHTQLRAILESSRDGILLVGSDLRILVVNGPAIAMLGLDGDVGGWTGRSLIALVRAIRRERPNLARSALGEFRRVRRGDVGPHIHEVASNAGTVRWLSLPVQDADSRLLVFQDVTAERALQRMREDLVHMTVHDLRNPLTVIWASLSQVRDDEEPEDPDEIANLIDVSLASVHKMLTLVNYILDVNRLETGEMPLARRECALAEVVARAERAQSALAAGQQVTLARAEVPEDARALIDADLIERVLQNLLDNAIRSTQNGGRVEIGIAAWSSSGPDGAAVSEPGAGTPEHYRVSVIDQGEGIPPGLEERLFERYATGSAQGVGLGLAFCKLAVEAHGGHIWAHNRPGGGAAFHFTVPVAPR